MNNCVFLDRDGVINENRDEYVRAWDDIQFFTDTFESMRLLAQSQFKIVIVTNQSAIGKKLITPEELTLIHNKLVVAIIDNGGRIDAIYSCYHTAEDHCSCRKPEPGLLLQAAEDLQINLSASFLIGDAWSDIQAGIRAGCTPILLRTGRGNSQLNHMPVPIKSNIKVCNHLIDAVEWIISVK